MSFKFTAIKEWQEEFKKRHDARMDKLFPCMKKTTTTKSKKTKPTVKKKS